MSNKNKSVQALIWGLFFALTLPLINGCAAVPSDRFQSLANTKFNCANHDQDASYTVVVNYQLNDDKFNCPHHVSFIKGDNGCDGGPKPDDKYPPVCLCAGKNEKLGWVADQKIPPNVEFAVHFSPFQNGSFESKKGEIKPENLVAIKKAPKPASPIYYEYSITAGADCSVIDPPVIIKQ